MVSSIIKNQDNNSELAISKAILLSGLYDLLPLQKSYLNHWLILSNDKAKELSPVHYDIKKMPPVLLVVGDKETPEFIRQSNVYADWLNLNGHRHEYIRLKNLNHYTVARQLSHRSSDLLKKVLG